MKFLIFPDSDKFAFKLTLVKLSTIFRISNPDLMTQKMILIIRAKATITILTVLSRACICIEIDSLTTNKILHKCAIISERRGVTDHRNDLEA